jgi:membrane dipeptidase
MTLTCLVFGCAQETGGSSGVDMPDLASKAQQIARSSIIVDTHIDVPARVKMRPADIANATDSGDFDYPRAIAGGLNAPFMSIYTPATLASEGLSRQAAESLISLVEGFVQNAPEKFALARSVSDVRAHFAAGLISLPMGMENGSPIEDDLHNVQHFYDRGIRYITLAHSKSNQISDSSYDPNRQWDGLSEFGIEVVREMNRVGIMIDVSHVSDEAFWQIMEYSETPVIASHSSARHFTPDFERNMSDEMIVALAEKGGVIQINFGSAFLLQESTAYRNARVAAGKLYKAEYPDMSESEFHAVHTKIFAEEHGLMPLASLDDVLDHFDHVTGLVGIEHLGIGSDFDGVGDTLPAGLKDVSYYPNLVKGLLRRGYSDEDIRKILGENLLRVWLAVEAHAANQR